MAAGPLVSVCVPAYEHGAFIGQAIESALAQSFADIEVVVSDNRSTDNTRDVVERLQQRDSRLRYEPAPEHLPMQANFNRCLALARGEYVKFLSADDLLEVGCVERLLRLLQDRPNAKLAACARRTFGDGAVRARVLRYAQEKVVCDGQAAIRKCFFLGNLIGEPTAVMFRRVEAQGGFSARYLQLVDLEMWFRLLENGEFAFVPEVLCAIREHDAQATRQSLASGRVSADKELLFAEFSGKPWLQGTLFERLLWDFRMAWSVERERAAGHARAASNAVYFQSLRLPMTIGARIAGAIRGR
jgi:glycosyltransferase involved in cell wall biosynthesis